MRVDLGEERRGSLQGFDRDEVSKTRSWLEDDAKEGRRRGKRTTRV